MYDITQEECVAAGMPRYEVSNHAAPGRKASTIKSLEIWRLYRHWPGARRITTLRDDTAQKRTYRPKFEKQCL